MITVVSCSEQETESLGAKLAAKLFPGAFLALWGDLGAGKTALCRGIGKALGVQQVMSPTFTIVQEHQCNAFTLFHFDVYRLSSGDELYDIGYEDYLARQGIIVMEWPGNVEEALPKERLDIRIQGSGEEPRSIALIAHGRAHQALLASFEETGIC